MSPKSIPPNDYGNSNFLSTRTGENCFLTDECQKIDITNLLRIALFELKKTFIQSQLQTEGITVSLLTSKAGFGGKRLWFACPLCQKRVGCLYKHPLNGFLACRACLNLKYRGSAKKGMIEGGFLK